MTEVVVKKVLAVGYAKGFLSFFGKEEERDVGGGKRKAKSNARFEFLFSVSSPPPPPSTPGRPILSSPGR